LWGVTVVPATILLLKYQVAIKRVESRDYIVDRCSRLVLGKMLAVDIGGKIQGKTAGVVITAALLEASQRALLLVTNQLTRIHRTACTTVKIANIVTPSLTF
jgi:hypothetical protein